MYEFQLSEWLASGHPADVRVAVVHERRERLSATVFARGSRCGGGLGGGKSRGDGQPWRSYSYYRYYYTCLSGRSTALRT